MSGKPTIRHPKTTAESYNTFIRQQENQRHKDRRQRLQTGSIDHRKRIANPILPINNYLGASSKSTINNYESSTSNDFTTNVSNVELQGDLPLLDIPITPYVLPICTYCKHCGAKKFYRESKGFCCSDGKIKLFISDSPPILFNLFTATEPTCLEFKKLVRGYNNHFAFTSFGVKYDKELFKSYKGIYTFRVQGQVYHYVNELIPKNNRPCYMQLYFYDTDNELSNRMKILDGFVESTLMSLIEILQINPYCRFFRSLSDITNLQNCQIHIRCHPGLDQRVFNTPTTSQVAAVWLEDDTNVNANVRDITIYGHSGDSHKVHYYYGCYDPLQYPLLFPYGEPGWHEGIDRCTNQSRNLPTLATFATTIASASEIIEKEDQGL
jgi:hypothetical protein